MYPDVKPVHQRLHPIHPKKATTIKAEVEKLLRAGFIYLVPLTEWVSNIVPVMKNQGTIRVCIDYRDVNHACPNTSILLPLSTILLTIVLEVKFFHSWIDFLATTKSISTQMINIRQHSSFPRAHSLIGNYRLV